MNDETLGPINGPRPKAQPNNLEDDYTSNISTITRNNFRYHLLINTGRRDFSS